MALALAIGLLTAGTIVNASGPTTVDLGTATSYAVLAGTPVVSSTGLTEIFGNVGIHPAASVTGFPPGIVHGAIHLADANALQAKVDLVTAYNYAAGLSVTANHTSLGGLTLVGGVYNAGGATLDLTGTLTLDGQNDPSSVWVFQATSDLVTASGSSVVFINGGDPCNVFWQVTSSATLGSGSTFVGTIMALESITVANAVTIDGRLLARNGQVTLINDLIRRSTCAAPVATPTPTPTPGATPTPTPTPGATPTPTPTPTPGPGATPTPTPTPGGNATPTPTPTPGAVGVRAVGTPVASLPNTNSNDINRQRSGIDPLLWVGLVFLFALSLSTVYLNRRVRTSGSRR